MADIIKIIDCDIVFLSYDEPNAEKNYTDLISEIPWAKRVHGVKGSDSAHKACANISDTEYFVTVDADNIINQDFLQVEIDLQKLNLTPQHVFSWCGKIYVNNLMYGNGGLKLWTKNFVNNMKTHENAVSTDEKGLVEFCFDEKYYQFNENYSISYTNFTPYQAWRSGFREGVKMSLDQGAKVVNINKVWWQNFDRLMIWCMVGADVENGLWTIYGAREGLYKTLCTDWNYVNVRDFDYLQKLWNEEYESIQEINLLDKIKETGSHLIEELSIPIAENPLDKDQSIFFKKMYSNSPRVIRRASA